MSSLSLLILNAEWSSINALLYYGPTLVQSIGISGDDVKLIVAGGIRIVQFIAVLPAIIYIDRMGKNINLFLHSTFYGPDFREKATTLG
jgi:hypothetical protein